MSSTIVSYRNSCHNSPSSTAPSFLHLAGLLIGAMAIVQHEVGLAWVVNYH